MIWRVSSRSSPDEVAETDASVWVFSVRDGDDAEECIRGAKD